MFANSAIVALFAGIAAAVHTPTTQWTTENAIHRPLNEAVTAGVPFTITWTADTTNPVSIVFLKGPSNNVQPVGSPIADNIANSGSFVWTPTADFGTSDGITGFGIEIIDSVTGQYQYSTQFGIKAGSSSAVSSVEAASTTAAASSAVVSSAAVSSAAAVTSAAAVSSVAAATNGTTTPCTTSTLWVAPTTPSVGASVAVPGSNGTVVAPTVPSTLLSQPSSTTTSSVPQQSFNAGAHLEAGMGLVLGVAGLFFML